MNDAPTIMITAADHSGDAHAAGLIEALRRRLPQARFVGMGGAQMAAAGCELLADVTRRSSMLGSSFRQVFYFLRLIRRLARAMDECCPAVHVPVDSPAANWHLARAARRRGVPVVYYIAPQVWAWAPWRVRKLRRLTDAVACILPFEPDYLRPRGVNAHYVGHPLFDGLPEEDPPDLASAARTGRWRIALVPGSRVAEIAAHAPALVTVMDRLQSLHPQAEFTFTALSEEAAGMIRHAAGRAELPTQVGNTAGVLARAHFAVVASGTVTLEVAYFGVPMVVFYRVNRWAYRLVGSWLLRTRYLSLVNILAGRELVPELMPWYGDPELLVRRAQEVLTDLDGLERTRRALLPTSPAGSSPASRSMTYAPR
jgi:lipid-A-disaccharide synthase